MLKGGGSTLILCRQTPHHAFAAAEIDTPLNDTRQELRPEIYRAACAASTSPAAAQLSRAVDTERITHDQRQWREGEGSGCLF